MSKENKTVLNLVFMDQYKKLHKFTPKYFKSDLTADEVKKVMETISKLKNLFELTNSEGQSYHPYQSINSAAYITTNIKKIF